MRRPVILLAFCILAESVLVSYPLTLLFLIIISIFSRENIDILAFVAGIALDLFTLRILGLDSIFFLIVIYIGERYRQKIYEGAFIYRLLFLMITFVIYNWLFYKSFNFRSILVTAITSSLLLVWYEKIFPEINKQKLSV